MMAKTEGRRRECQRMKWLDGITNVSEYELRQISGDGRGREAWRAAVHGVAELDTTGQLNNNKQNTRIK